MYQFISKNMGAKVIFLFVLALLIPAFAQGKNCSDCVGYRTCEAAVVAIQKTDPAMDEQLRSVFCGFDSLGLPMVCCSELTAATHSPLEDSVDTHPNRRLLPETCGYAEDSKHVIIIGGGHPAGLHEYPWMVLIAYKTRRGPQFKCGGSLINKHYVLTAAHCISSQELLGVRVGEYNIDTSTDCQGEPPNRKCESNIQAVSNTPLRPSDLGQHRPCSSLQQNYTKAVGADTADDQGRSVGPSSRRIKASPGLKYTDLPNVRTMRYVIDPLAPQLCDQVHLQDLRIEEAIPHPEYHGLPTIRNDVGLLRLKKPVNLTFENAGIICLPVSSDLRNRDIGGLSGYVAGWGHTEKGYVSSTLLTVDVPIHTAEYCRELYNRGTKPGDEDETVNKICAGLNGKDSCRGDSGGPLMMRTRSSISPYNLTYVQYGIVSYGPLLCGSQFPGVYTDVTKYMKWILDNMKP